jgi:hypothetical protein
MSTTEPLEPKLERLSAEARQLLWVLSRATSVPVPEALVEKVFAGESVEDEKLRQIGRMMAAFERLPHEARPEAPAMPDEVRARIALLEQKGEAPKPDLEPLVGELVEARLVTRAPLVEGGAAMGLSFADDVALAMTMWMEARPGECGVHDDKAVRLAFGERYAAAFVAAVEGKIPLGTDEAAIDAGKSALAYFLAAGAMDAIAKMLGEAVRVANDATIVGPVAFFVEDKGALDAVQAAFIARNDALGEAGTLAALAGHRMDSGDRDAAIALELRSLNPLAKLDNVVPRAIVHRRLSGLYEDAGREAESRAHLAAAIIYRALSGADFSSELRVVMDRLRRDPSFTLPFVRALVAGSDFAELARYIRSRGVPVLDVQVDLDALVTQVKRHIANEITR